MSGASEDGDAAVRSGRLRAARFGAHGVYRVRPDDVNAWIAGSVVDPAAVASSGAKRPGMLMLDVREVG